MKRPGICAVITGNDFEIATGAARFVDLYEVRIDLTGDGWQDWVKRLRKPWVASNRRQDEGGNWTGNEPLRVGKLFKAVEFGARIVDIELNTDGLPNLVTQIKKEKAACLISTYYKASTPDLHELKEKVNEQITAGADICKIVTRAGRFEDNFTLLNLFGEFPKTKLVAFADGPEGVTSRVLSVFAGGYFTYASITAEADRKDGMLAAAYLRSLYEAVKKSQNPRLKK